jgi:hypothetical protein
MDTGVKSKQHSNNVFNLNKPTSEQYNFELVFNDHLRLGMSKVHAIIPVIVKTIFKDN